MTAGTDLTTYDPFTGPELDATRWQPLAFGPHVRLEPEATTTVGDGTVTVDIPVFCNADVANQGLDNSKHVLLSTHAFDLPAAGVARFAVDLRAEVLGDASGDYRQGVAAFILVDTDGGTHTVYDMLCIGERYLAEHEVLAVPGVERPFTRVVDDPFFLARSTAQPDDGFRRCAIEVDRAAGRVVWTVDGEVLFEAAGLTGMPQQVHVGLGFFTLAPLGVTSSAHGQGARASWRHLECTVSD